MAEDFEFFVPIEKSGVTIDPITGDVFVDGPLSTVRRDLQGERVLEGAVASGLDTFIRLNMPIDYNHLSVKTPTPKEFDEQGAPVRFIMGEGVELRDGPSPAGGLTKYLRARLYKSKRSTQDCLEHFRAGGKLYYSIGGSAERRNGDVLRTKISHVAVTPYPANPDCEIGLVGVGALAKSMRLDVTDSPSAMVTQLERLTEQVSELNKTLTAGSGPAMGATGGRALGEEDLEGAGKTDCKCKGKCKCDRASSNSSSSLDDDIRDASPEAHRKDTKMSKVLDKDTADELAALETDPKLGPIAKGFAFLVDAISSLKKGGKDDDDKEDDDKEDDETNYGDGDGKGEDEDNLGKGFVPYFDENPNVVDVSMEEFQKGLLAAMDRRFSKLEKAVKSHVDTQIGAAKADLAKSFAEANTPTTELLKTLDQLGMRPRPTGAPSGAYQAADAGRPSRTRDEIFNLLEKGVAQGKVTAQYVTAVELGHEAPTEELLKSLAA